MDSTVSGYWSLSIIIVKSKNPLNLDQTPIFHFIRDVVGSIPDQITQKKYIVTISGYSSLPIIIVESKNPLNLDQMSDFHFIRKVAGSIPDQITQKKYIVTISGYSWLSIIIVESKNPLNLDQTSNFHFIRKVAGSIPDQITQKKLYCDHIRGLVTFDHHSRVQKSTQSPSNVKFSLCSGGHGFDTRSRHVRYFGVLNLTLSDRVHDQL